MAHPESRKCCCPSSPPPTARRESPGNAPSTKKGASLPSPPAPWVTGSVSAAGRGIPRVSTTLRPADRLGAWKARWGLGRMRYLVEPGLYAAGRATSHSPVLVSANYKMSFDRLRSELEGVDAWILVLDTKGINVWCAAGKGTFGTDELAGRIEATGLAEIVSHREVVVPQLGAPGVAAHEVCRRSGFQVIYGPVRAENLPAFLKAGMNASPEMRRVRFPLRDRLAVVPVELAMSAKYVLLVVAAFFLLAGLGTDGYSLPRAVSTGAWSVAVALAALVGGTVLGPALLPWLPGRAFALKGLWIGLAMLPALAGLAWIRPEIADDWLTAAAWCLLIPTITSFALMNFTGSTTYTSLSGVRREVRIAAPIQIVCAVLGAALWLAGRFV